MAIPETQLEVWSSQGSITQSASTYQNIRSVLNDSKSPYHSHSFDIFLQGSYGNDTNVYRDSDVGIVIRLNSTYFYDKGNLTPQASATFDSMFSAATYGYADFKSEVIAWLKKNYGASVVPGTKAIFIKGQGNRRDADVIVCTNYYRYHADSNGNDEKYNKGIFFMKSDGTRIHNFPRQHSDNCTAKHQRTSSWFKPIVRIYKNMRNHMVANNVIKEGLAPSYFIEGLISNAPDALFGKSYEDTFIGTFNWLNTADKTKLTCASGLHWLARDNAATSWSTADLTAYLVATSTYWKDWK